MKNSQFISSIIFIFLISFFPTLILAQQPYIRQASSFCEATDNSTSVLGYTCNGLTPRCQSYLTFRAQPPFDTVATISTLLSVNASELARLNSVPENSVFETGRTVLIPVPCSCSGQYYQYNSSYVVRTGDTYFVIANNTFQGLSTCQALQAQNSRPVLDLNPGDRLTVPIRCACPTRTQTEAGVNYLLSYLVTWNQFVSEISDLFGVDFRITLAANGLSEQDPNIYPFTTLLIPLENPPTSSQVTAPQPPPPASANPSPVEPENGGGSSKTWIYAVVGAVGGIVLVGAVVFFVFFRKHKKQKAESTVNVVSSQSFESVEKPLKKGEGDDFDSESFLESISSIAQSLKVYTFQELKSATEDFSPDCLIKGSVYRGKINGDYAAIKKMNSGDVSKEINLLNKINHFNLIRLSGVSFNEGDWYLVYEYASNGPLSDWIHGGDKRSIMDWNKRLQICLDIASGLSYLHHYTSTPHVHKDLNSTNVLLDGDFRAKIANFGLAREGQEGEFALTRHIVGTKGYMAPEYLENGIVSSKLDVYAFGVIVMEILTGKEVSVLFEELNMGLLDVLKPVLSEDGRDGHEKLRDVMDPSLRGKYPPDLALVLFRWIDGCLKKDPSDRPNMDDIFQSLSRISNSTVSGEWSISISESGSMPR